MKARHRKFGTLTQKKLQEIRGQLLRRREELQQVLTGEFENLPSGQGTVRGELADAALDFATEEMSYQAVEIAARELRLIERALQKMHQGCYGLCENCGQPVGSARLEALPCALYCIVCQRELEALGPDRDCDRADWERVEEIERDENEPEVNLHNLEAEAHS